MRLDRGLRARAVKLLGDKTLYAGAPKPCEHPAGYAIRFRFASHGHRDDALDLLFSAECGTVDIVDITDRVSKTGAIRDR